MSELNGNTCGELADVAAELALGVLTGRERAGAIAHLNTCEACREDVRQLMATGEQLRELLPSAEPPAGFEIRVLTRLGLPAPAEGGDENEEDEDEAEDEQDTGSPLISGREHRPRHRRGTARPGGRQASAPPARSGEARSGGRLGSIRRPGRIRRVLAAAAVGLAVIVAGLGGWRIGVDTAPVASAAAGPLSSASLLSSSTQQHVGRVFVYSGTPGWLYMSVDLGSGSDFVTCQVVGADGQVTTIGSFRLADGYGAWGSPNPGYLGKLSGARLVSSTGTVLAAGTFTH
jgi:hypothetical protein